MKKNTARQWNRSVAQTIKKLQTVKSWLGRRVNGSNTDWDTQKSAHQAIKFLELAEYEMWNMQYWENERQRRIYRRSEDTIA